MACGTFDVDIISLEMGNRLPFYFKHTTVGLAIDRGIYFEISYAPAIRGIYNQNKWEGGECAFLEGLVHI